MTRSFADSRSPSIIRDALQLRIRLSDAAFDQIYAPAIRTLSRLHWTPVSVALRAAELLAREPGMRVLDIGSGVGKLCCIGALATDATWYGVERDGERVSTALEIARALGVETRVRFMWGDMTCLEWADFDSLYLFNPFEADLYACDPTDPRVAYPRYTEYVRETEQRLAELRSGTRVLTYHGFGGEMPGCFEVLARENIGSDQLVLWVKRPRVDSPRWRAVA